MPAIATGDGKVGPDRLYTGRGTRWRQQARGAPSNVPSQLSPTRTPLNYKTRFWVSNSIWVGKRNNGSFMKHFPMRTLAPIWRRSKNWRVGWSPYCFDWFRVSLWWLYMYNMSYLFAQRSEHKSWTSCLRGCGRIRHCHVTSPGFNIMTVWLMWCGLNISHAEWTFLHITRCNHPLALLTPF